MSKIDFNLSAEVRTDLGKGASRRLRRNAGLVPAILYGAGKDPVSLSIVQNELQKSCENEAFFAHIINLKVGGKKENAIIKALQRHPATERIMHADFLRVKMDQEIHVDVPLHFMNEEDCVGVKQDGGMVSHQMSSLQVTCLPGDLPEFIEVDVLDMVIGSALHMSDLQLPSGVTIPELSQGDDHDQVVVSVTVTRAIIEESDEGDDATAADSETDSDSEESTED
jgi:large subunit ribosomal protein L25